jgi:nitrate/nitrite-specific signal transduction histidine kinase
MSFQRKTTLAIVLIALFVIGNQVFIGCWLIQKKYDAKVINVSGKQRMLSQRIMALTFDSYYYTKVKK